MADKIKRSVKTHEFTRQSTSQYYLDYSNPPFLGKDLLAVFLDNNQWFAGIYGYNKATGHTCVRFIDVGSGNPILLNDKVHTFTFVYAD